MGTSHPQTVQFGAMGGSLFLLKLPQGELNCLKRLLSIQQRESIISPFQNEQYQTQPHPLPILKLKCNQQWIK